MGVSIDTHFSIYFFSVYIDQIKHIYRDMTCNGSCLYFMQGHASMAVSNVGGSMSVNGGSICINDIYVCDGNRNV